MLLHKIDSKIARLQARFPLANYGWKREMMTSAHRRVGSEYHLVLPERDSFDCKTTSCAAAEEFGGAVVGLRVADQHNRRRFFSHYIAVKEVEEDVCVVGLTPFDKVLGFYPYRFFPRECFSEMRETMRASVEPKDESGSPRTIVMGHGSIPIEAIFKEERGGQNPVLHMSSLSYHPPLLSQNLGAFGLNIGTYVFDADEFSYHSPINLVIKRCGLGFERAETGRHHSGASLRAFPALERSGFPVLEKIFLEFSERENTA